MDKDQAMYDYGWKSAIEQCAAGPWIDGPPPKDEHRYLSYYGPGDVGMTSWCPTVQQWNIEDGYTDKDPIKHAVINLPKEEE